MVRRLRLTPMSSVYRTRAHVAGLAASLAVLFFGACDSASGGSKTLPTIAQKVTTAGGTIVAGDTEVIIPPGAVASDVTLTVAAASSSIAALPTEVDAAGAAVAFTPHGTTFATPVTLKIAYTGAADTVLRLADESDTTWEVVEGAVFEGGVATFQTSTFSIYVATNRCGGLCDHAAGVCGVPNSGGKHGDCVSACTAEGITPNSACGTERAALLGCYAANTSAAEFQCATDLHPTAANCAAQRQAVEQCLNPTPAATCKCFTMADLEKALADVTSSGGTPGVGPSGATTGLTYAGCAFGKQGTEAQWGTSATATSILFISLVDPPPASSSDPFEKYFGWFTVAQLNGADSCGVWRGDSSPLSGPTEIGPLTLTTTERDGCLDVLKAFKAAQTPAWTCFEQH